MKITTAGRKPIEAIRDRRAPGAGEPAAALAATNDSVEILGVPEAELTRAVRKAIHSLLTQVDELRGDVGRLKARLSEAEGLADRDALTPLLNRRAFLRELARVGAHTERYGNGASLVYFDLDGFKAINDRHGHAAGDAALRTVAEQLAANVRESDVLGRIGGDEFALILAHADRATAESKAAALAEAIERNPLAFPGGTATVRASFGVCEIFPGAEPETLLARADSEMFTAKRMRKAG